MSLDRLGGSMRSSLAEADQCAPVAEDVKQRIQTADMIHPQKHERPKRLTALRESLQKAVHAQKSGLTLSGRTGGEQNQPG